MKFKNRFLLLTWIPFLFGCSAGRISSGDSPSLSLEKKIYEASLQSKKGAIVGPIILKARKLGIDEIASHLNMDKETAQKHLQTSNIHGYYSLIAKNVPPQGEFTLYHVNLEGKVHPYKTFIAQENGTLASILDDLWIDLSNNFLFFASYLPGEPVDFVLTSHEGKIYGAVHIIPNPIELNWERWLLSVEMITANRRQYLVRCCGLEPSSALLMRVQFEQEQQAYVIQTDQKGEIAQVICPNNPKLTGGEGAIELRGEGLTRTLYLPFKWGK